MTQANNTAQLIVSTRAGHAAMAASVATAGLACSQDLYKAAADFNATHFAGVLTAILVEIAAPGSPRALATHEPRTPEGVDCMIRIAPGVVEAGTKLAHDVLLREMIHVWQAETDNREPEYAGHGPKFAAKCNEIGKALGLAEVGVKGRGGLPDCAQWPLNVRPEGYYGNAPRAQKAVAKAAKRKSAPKEPKAAVAPLDAAVAAYEALSEDEQVCFRDRLGLGA